jgi:hypothetical protein
MTSYSSKGDMPIPCHTSSSPARPQVLPPHSLSSFSSLTRKPVSMTIRRPAPPFPCTSLVMLYTWPSGVRTVTSSYSQCASSSASPGKARQH